jgi:hypothetical protein
MVFMERLMTRLQLARGFSYARPERFGPVGHVASAVGMALVLLAASACLQPSLHPLLLPADVTFDARLLGEWTSDKTVWTFSKATDDKEVQALFGSRSFYEVTLTESGEVAKLWAWVGQLENTQFINFFPDDSPVTIKSGFYKGHVIGAHTFGRVRLEDDHLHLDMLDSDWVKKATNEGRVALGPKRWPDGEVGLLTASTSELQRFAREHAYDKKAFGEHVELVRQKSHP